MPNASSSRPARALALAVLLAALAAACAGGPAPEPAAAGAPVPPPEAKPKTDFARFASRFTRDSLALSPPAATLAGLHRHRDSGTGREIVLDRELDDFSAAATGAKIALYRDALDTLDRDYPEAALEEQERIDRALIAATCRLALLDLERVKSAETNPTAAVESLGTALFFPVVFEYAPAGERAEDLLARLQQVPAFVDHAIAALRSSAPIYTQVAEEENEGNRDVVEHVLPTLFKDDAELRSRFETTKGEALAAIDRLQRFLTTDLPKRRQGDWRLGPDLYREKFAAYFQEDLDPAAVLRDAEQSLKRVRDEMLALARPLHDEWYPGHDRHRAIKDHDALVNTVVRETLDRIGRDHPARDELFSTIETDVTEIAAWIETHPLLSLTRHDNLAIIETPPFLRGIYGVAGLNAAPPLEPSLKSLYYVTPIPADWPQDKAEAKLREYNRYKLILLSMHEAMPGHYTQLEYANRVRPEWRRVLRSIYGNNAMIEGWGQYAEEVMLEQGFRDARDPRMALTFRKEELRVLANAILDVRLHTLGMTDAQAIQLMTRDTFQERPEAEGKLRRAKLSSAQLPTYFVGWQAWRRLRRDAQAREGGAFDLKAWHDRVLSHGSIPMGALRHLTLPEPAADATPVPGH